MIIIRNEHLSKVLDAIIKFYKSHFLCECPLLINENNKGMGEI